MYVNVRTPVHNAEDQRFVPRYAPRRSTKVRAREQKICFYQIGLVK